MMRKLLQRTSEVIAYMFHKKGFFTKKLVVGTMTLVMMLFLDIRCHVWDGLGIVLLVLLTLYVVANYMIRYIEMRKDDEEKARAEEKDDDGTPGSGEASLGPGEGTEVGEGENPESSPSGECTEDVLR